MAPSASPLPAINYVFVDFENVTNLDLALFGQKSVSIAVLVGANQTKLDVNLVQRLFDHPATVQFIRLTSSGKNALDFTLSCYLGRAIERDPHAYFHIISRDTGFDPLVEHLQSRRVRVRRHENFHDQMFAPPAKIEATANPPPPPPPAPDLVQRALEYLTKNKTNRPKRKKTLINQLSSLLGKDGTEPTVGRVIAALTKANRLAIDAKGVVTYPT